MVNDTYNIYKKLEGGPPPLDESWWEAVLAEDEATTAKRQPSHRSSRSTEANTRNHHYDIESIDWELTAELYAQDKVCDLEVTGYNRGGLLVGKSGLQGFVPISHLVDVPGELSISEQEEVLKAYIGQSLRLKVIECDQERGRVVFSERAALASPGVRNQLLNRLQAGDRIRGKVTNITDFGVFIDLGGF